MSETPNDVENLSPYRLLSNFSKNRVVPCIVLALVIHLLVIGASSANYIYHTWIDPAAKPEDSAKAEQAGESPDRQPEAKTPDAEEAAKAAGADKAGDPSKSPATAEGQDAPVVQRITETPKPGETPADPDDIGISLEDTNR